MQAKKEAPDALHRAEGQTQSPEDRTEGSQYSLALARQQLRRLLEAAHAANHEGLLDRYIGMLAEEMQLLNAAIAQASAADLDAWRKASGHVYLTQREAHEDANARFAEQMAEREIRRAG